MAKTRPGKKDLDSYTIKGTNKVVRAGDCVLMRPSDTGKPPYVACVEKIETDNRNNVKVRVRWYYRPEESIGGRRQFHGAKELFLSDHYDVQSGHTIEGKCTVHSFKNYTKLENVTPEDYYCRFEYKAATGGFTPDRVAVYHPACVDMTIEEAKNLEQFVCSECSSDDDVKKSQNAFTASPGVDAKIKCDISYSLFCGAQETKEMTAFEDSVMIEMISSCSSILKVLFILVIITACIAEERALFMVMMEGDPVAFHDQRSHTHKHSRVNPNSEVSKAHAKRLVESHDQLLMETLESGSYSKLYSFKHVLNGFAIHTTPSQASKLKYAKGVKIVEKDRGAKMMTTYTPEFLGLPQRVWTEEGGERNAGDGIVIGFVDTGIDPTHPSFAFDPLNPFISNISSHFSGACESGPRFPPTSCNGKIVSARFFSAGAQAAATLNTSVDFLSPFDALGHGSHVASTAGGNAGVPVVVNGFFYGRASGMAPRARISVYKAVYPTVATLTDVVSAIDQAVVDGVDILTLSVGPDEAPEDTITFLNIFDIAILYARRAGVFVVQAAGNKGPGPSTVVSFSPWAVGVAAASTDRTYPGSLLLGNGQKIGGVGLSGPSFGDGFFLHKLILAKDAVKTDGSFPKTVPYIDECQYPEAFDPNVVKGSIVICTFSEGFFNGTSTVTAVTNTAKALGFSGFLLVANPTYGDFVAEPIPFDVSGILIPYVADVQVILHYYEERTHRDEKNIVRRFGAKALIGEGRVAYFKDQEPTVSRFSSRGPDIIDANRNLADVLKPDIVAPGHQIWAAWSPMSVLEPTLAGFSFALLSGTSMATPHVAGVAALIKQLNPSWTPSMIASAIATTATKYDENNGRIIMAEGYGIGSLYPSTAFEFGSGLVSPKRALDPGLVFSSGYEDYIAFLCSLPGMDPATIKNATGESCNGSLTHPDNLNLPSITISALNGSRSVHRTVKNVQRKPETYLCAVLPPNGTAVSVHPPWFTIASEGSQELVVEFNVTKAMDDFSFGEIVLTGSLNHIIRIPISVYPIKV
ncbi:hypothetical protein F8388_027266 [Cannabis sativa]|uniref:BAH domain-containing protein n=1 Tax=Cannabis sativa TaxID=3483 RepID=A0A7J6HWC1_CANSA|nr:hypothetical protein F8388_027266 [Cannabis sativa]KAF4399553.1 hypothetical protein G4B88_022636 [Cannabis sativa]